MYHIYAFKDVARPWVEVGTADWPPEVGDVLNRLLVEDFAEGVSGKLTYVVRWEDDE